MPTRPEDALTAEGSGTVEPAEGAHSPIIASGQPAAAAPVVVEASRDLKRAKRAEAKAKKRADAAAKKASLAYAQAAAALRNLEEASQKAAAIPAAAPAAAAVAAAAPAPSAEPAVAASAAAAASSEASATAESAPAAETAPTPEAAAAAGAAAPAAVAVEAPAPAPAAVEAAPAPAAATAAPASAVPAAAVETAPAPAPAVGAAPVPQAAPAVAAAVAAPIAAPMPAAAPVAAMAPAGMPPVAAAAAQPGIPPYVIVQPRRGHSGAVALTIVGVLLAAALVAAGVFAYQHFMAPKAETSDPVPTAVGPVANSTGIPLAKVSLRANAEGWAEETSTPVVAHIQRIDGGASGSSSAGSSSSSAPGASSGASSSSATTQAAAFAEPATTGGAYRPSSADGALRQAVDSSSSASGASSSANAGSSSSSSSSGSPEGGSVSDTANADYDAYHAFSANESSTLSLIPGRYMFTYITPLNSDRSLYEVPEPVEVTVGDDGTALLPVELTRVAPEDVTDEQAEKAMAALRVAMAHGDGSFSNATFKTAYDKAFSEWFAPKEEEVELTDEERRRLEEQVGSASSSSSSAASSHSHAWTAVTEDRVVTYTATVVESPAWDEPIYDSRGNIMGFNYHPAVTRNEERQRTERVIVGYRCSECGAAATA